MATAANDDRDFAAIGQPCTSSWPLRDDSPERYTAGVASLD